MVTVYGKYHNPHNGWSVEIWPYTEDVVEIRSSGMPYYFMTLDGAKRWALTLERVSGIAS